MGDLQNTGSASYRQISTLAEKVSAMKGVVQSRKQIMFRVADAIEARLKAGCEIDEIRGDEILSYPTACANADNWAAWLSGVSESRPGWVTNPHYDYLNRPDHAATEAAFEVVEFVWRVDEVAEE